MVAFISSGVSGSIQPAETALGAVAPSSVTANTTIIAAAAVLEDARGAEMPDERDDLDREA